MALPGLDCGVRDCWVQSQIHPEEISSARSWPQSMAMARSQESFEMKKLLSSPALLGSTVELSLQLNKQLSEFLAHYLIEELIAPMANEQACTFQTPDHLSPHPS